MKFIVSHPTGNTFVKALLEELFRRELLEFFSTSIGFGQNKNPIFSKFKNRRSYNIPDSKIKRSWYPEVLRLLLRGDQTAVRQMTDFSYACLDANTSRKISIHSSKFIHSYEDCASNTFNRAKELGIQCSYELPIAYWATGRRILAEEAERYPEWEPTLETTRESEEKLQLKEEELKLADRITCPSQFVLDSLPQEIREGKRCQISPFGSPASFRTDYPPHSKKSRKFKILFVGSMSQRKGLADLFSTMKLLKNEPVELSVLGQPSMPKEFYRKQYSDFEYFPPCSNDKVRDVMSFHDALVLPSLIEGRALVQQEALSCGLPIIVTANAGGEDLIDDGETGYIVPIRSPQHIADKIISMMQSRIPTDERKILCEKKAASITWKNYAKKIIDFNLSRSH